MAHLRIADRAANAVLAGWGSCISIAALLVLLAPPAGARELVILVPSNADSATREYLSALSGAPELKSVDIALKPVRADSIAGNAGDAVLKGDAPLGLIRSHQLRGFETDRDGLVFTTMLAQPLMIRDSSEQFHVEDSVVGDAILQELGRKGFVVLGFWNSTPTSLVSRKRVRDLSDLKGFKVSAPSSGSSEVLAALGATALQLQGADTYAALDRGLVDALETQPQRDNAFLTLQMRDGGSLLANFQQGQGFLVVNETAWVGLRQRERAALQAAAARAQRNARMAVLRAEAELRASAQAAGTDYKSFSGLLRGGENPARQTWLQRAGPKGQSALELLDAVRRTEPRSVEPGDRKPISSAPPRIFFATNRNDEGGGDLSHRFGIDRVSTSLVCGEVEYTPDSERSFGDVYSGFMEAKGQRTVSGAAECARLLADAASSFIVFIHGYKNSFDFAVRRAIAFARDFQVTSPVVVFSWPSQDTVSGYVYDLGSVAFTRPFAKDFVLALLSKTTVEQVSLLAHSMGSQIAFHLLEVISEAKRRVASVVFVAPDVPRDNFVQGIKLYGGSVRLATMYANEYDRALAVSETVNKQSPAGLGGTALLTAVGLETIDVSEVDRQFLEVNHSHGFDVPEVATDVSLVLRQGISASLRNLPSATKNGMTYWVIRK